MSEWKRKTLGDLEIVSGGTIQTGPFGSQLHMSDYSAEGVPVVMPTNIAGMRIDPSGIARVDVSHVERLAKHRLRKGDIVYSRRGDVEKCALVTDTEEGWLCGTGCINVRVQGPQVDPVFLSYALSMPKVQEWIRRHSVGATMANLNTSILREVAVPIPSMRTQRAIAEVLGALDDKIAANRRTIDTADTLRAAIWGKATRDAHHVLLSSLAAFINGGAFTKGASGNGRPVIRIVEMNQGVSDATVRTDLEVKDDQVVRAGDFLMSWSGSLTTSRWFGEESILNQHIFKVIPAEGVPLWAVASAVETKMPYFQFVASNKATTMGHIQRHHLDEDVAWPTVTSALNLQGTALWDLALAAERENQVLASTRDELLPLLMSGRITVGAASSHVEEVV